MKNISKYIIILFLSILGSGTITEFVGQDEPAEPVILFGGKLTDAQGRKMAGVTVKFLKDGSPFQSLTTATSGKYTPFEAEYGHVYKVTFSKPGYVTKTVIVDAKKGYYAEDVPELKTDFGLDASMIKKNPDVDYSIVTSKPVAKARIDPSNGELNYDYNYIGTRSKEIQKFMEELTNKANENEERFNKLVSEGDKATSSGSFQTAIDKYEEALKIKEDDDVITKIADAEIKLEELADQKALDEKFNKAIQAGDALLGSNDFDGAIAKYNEAKGLKPGEKLPGEKIKTAEEKRANAEGAALDKKFADKMAEANALLGKKSYQDAIAKYKEAGEIKPAEKEPKSKIAEIEKILADQQALEAKYQSLITTADQSMTDKNYDNAIAKYEEAIKIKGDEAYPKDQVAKAKELKAKDQEAADLENKYKDLISKADGEFGSEKWEVAKTTYQEALALKSGEQHPKDRIAAIDAKLKELADAAAAEEAANKKYNDLISEADGEFGSEKWETAKTTYQEALALKPDEKHPKDRISAIDAKLKELADADAAAAELNQKYDALITKADGEFGSEKWEVAKSTYQEALKVKSEEQHPKDRIASIDAKLKELADADAAAAELNKKYDALIKQADKDFGSENWEVAKSSYQEALKLKAGVQHPKDQIAVIDAKLKELADADAAAAELNKKYDALITKADGDFGSEKWESAKSTYQEALAIKSGEQHPKDRIAAIDAKLKELANADAAAAELNKKYDALITKADGEFGTEKWENAKKSYQEALGLKPGEQHPKDQLVAIEVKLKDLAAQGAADEAAKQKEKQFNDLIAQGDGELSQGKLEVAKETYQKAAALKPDDAGVKTKIAAVEAKIKESQSAAEAEKAEQQKLEKFKGLVKKGDDQFAAEDLNAAKSSYTEALVLYPDNAEVKQKLKKVIDAIALKSQSDELEGKYAAVIAKADAARDAEDWDNAKALYTDAHGIKGSETYPQEQIDWINKTMKEQSDAEVDKQYNKIIGVADTKFDEADYAKSKELYERALNMRPNDPYPKQKIAEIAKKISELAADAEKNKQYDYLVAEADNQFESEKWNEALVTYNKALAIKSEQYPKDQIKKIEAKISAADSEAAKKAQYDALITKGDTEFNSKDWSNARASFTQASELFPSESYPKKKLAEIEQIIDDLTSAGEKETQYKALIAKADAARDAKDWDNAKGLYKDAFSMKSSDSYPQEQIDWINKKMQEMADDEVNKQYQKIIDIADQKFNEADYTKSKELFKRANKMRPGDPYPPKKIAEIDAKLKALADKSADADALKAKYNALIAKADAARDKKDWNKAKDLYKDAHTTKSDESYPQEQIDWINGQMKNLANDEVDKQYQKIIKVADGLFDKEDYEKSKGLYKRAMGMKPNDSYPPARIKEINKLLGQTETVVENVSSDTKVFIENPYGEEVTGKYNEDDVTAMMKRGRIDDDDYRTEIIKERKETKLTELDEVSSNQSDRGDKNHEDFETLNTNRSQENIENDDPRLNNIPEVESYKDGDLETNENRNNYSTDVTYDNYEATESYETMITEFSSNSDIPRQDNVDEVHDYKESELGVLDGKMDYGQNLTYDNYEAKEAYDTRITEFTIDSDKPRQTNVKEVETYTEGHLEERVDRMGNSETLTYNNYEAKEAHETRTTEFNLDADNPRQDNVKNVETYTEGNLGERKDRMGNSEELTYNNYEAKEAHETRTTEFNLDADDPRQANVKNVETYTEGNLGERIDRMGNSEELTYNNYEAKEAHETRTTEFNSKADDPRQTNVKDVDDYNDGHLDKRGSRMENSEESTYDNYEAKEAFDTRITEFTIDSDEQRQNNVKNVHDYKEENLGTLDGEIGTSTDRTYSTYEDKENLKTTRNDWMTDADDPRKENAENVVDYQDDKLNSSSDRYEDDKDNTFDNADDMDGIKHQSPTMFVDENQQQLAKDYPEGITEKMFERRNGRGDVIEVTILRIVVRGLKGDEYKKVTTKWSTSYFKNGGVISEYVWDTETN